MGARLNVRLETLDIDDIFFETKFNLDLDSRSRINILSKYRSSTKVLLRERNRHTARRVSSTPSAVLSRVGGGTPSLYPSSVPGQDTPIWTWLGYPYLNLARVPPSGPGWGTPPRLDLARVPTPVLTWPGVWTD